ncbi:hypothetical protein PENSPDRAFT_750620 [Peniophora sp. CONT]|nr:hypothetical protein PENSPDRAFT_750620 [Peniophora sp. CONT]
MSDEAMLYCARKLNVDQPREVYSSGVLVHTFKEDGIGYLGLTRSLLLSHLERYGRVPAGSITFEGYTGQGCPRVFSLFNNYDVRFKRERAKRFSKRSVDEIRMELIKGFEGFDSPRPRLMWYWDTIKCGFGYTAPWDEFNLVSRALTPQWNTPFDAGPVETTDDKPQSPRGRTSAREVDRG